MKNKSKSNGFSRRKFIKGVGTGVASTYLYTPGLAKITKKIEKETEDFIEGKQSLSLKVNGRQVKLKIKPNTMLVELLRNHLKLTGTKVICNHGECGSCTVLLDGKAVYSCHILAMDAEGREVTTIEGLMKGEELHPIQEAFKENDGLQCGFCTPGQVMTAHALLLKTPSPTREDVLKAMSGNLCKCAAYPKITESVLAAAENK